MGMLVVLTYYHDQKPKTGTIMTLAPFYAAPGHIQTHIVAALVVAGLSPLQFWGFRKGSLPHRVSGYLWMAAMLVVAISSFWIRPDAPFHFYGFGPIHLLSLLALYSVVMTLRAARRGDIEAHRKGLRGLSIGFWLAAAFTLMPPRIMHQIVFG